MNRDYELNLIWDYKPKRSTNDHHFFEGPFKRTLLTNGLIKNYEIELALLGVINSAQNLNGLDQIQELTHKTSGRTLWIVDNLSLDGLDEILKHSKKPFRDILRNSFTTILLPSEYKVKPIKIST
jgi:hypothetical protein